MDTLDMLTSPNTCDMLTSPTTYHLLKSPTTCDMLTSAAGVDTFTTSSASAIASGIGGGAVGRSHVPSSVFGVYMAARVEGNLPEVK